MIVYQPLWETMKKQRVTAYHLVHYHGYSSHTIYRLRHNLGISTALLNDLCELLDCRVEDILEYTPDRKEKI